MRRLWLGLGFSAAIAAGQDFVRDVKPVLEANCLACHNAQRNYAGVRLETAALAAKAIVAGAPEKSSLWMTMEIAPGKIKAMPPGGPQLPQAQRDIVKQWIAAGAKWPDGVTLAARTVTAKLDEKALVEQLHKRISAQPAAGVGQPYKNAIPGTLISYEMVPVAAGEFVMGTPESEKGRKADEGPQHKVRVDAFWMQKYEVTWDEYRLFMFSQQAGEKAGADTVVDAVSRPTRPYVEMSFGMGINGYPAISMTQHAANKYAQWLSARTGHFYRLPTEAEWEYACRAGSTDAYGGVDVAKLGEYAWFAQNSNGKYEKVGTKKPNAWGLYDMLGNVMEWTLDQYTPDYSQWKAPWVKSTKPYPHVARGGSWNDEAEALRCGVRVGSDASWKMQDPQLPKSIWYLTDAQFLGFRLVRPVKVPTAAEMFQYWNNGVEKE
ncbi:MAG: formylglycine-generating enzyme family protein [Acidobacteria bacterium]|nr:formylglycine-generating enzyme family protein [Acidobacteriota bacterium]